MEKTTVLSFLICFVVLLFPHAITTGQGELLADRHARSQRDFVTLGNKWHVYLLAVTYDIANNIVYTNPGSLRQAPQSISALTEAIPRTINHTYPCQTLLITEAQQLVEYQHTDKNGILYHGIDADSKLCGMVSSIFVIPTATIMALGMERSDPWRWTIRAHPEFTINLTFLYMHVAMASQCTTLQAMVIGGPLTLHKTVYCPEFPIMSFYSFQNVILVLLRPASQYLVRFYEQHFFKNYANFSFVYQIHDNDFLVWTRFPDYRWKSMVKWNLLSYKQSLGKTYLMMLYDFTDPLKYGLELNILYPINITAQLNTQQTLAVFGSGNTGVYTFHIQSHLGDRIAVKSGRVPCIGKKQQVIFYDGPFVDFLMIDHLLPRLHTWVCEQPLDLPNNSIISSVGDIALVFMLSEDTTIFNGSILSLWFEAYLQSNSNWSQGHTILLNETYEKHTISVNMEGTFMHNVAVISDKYIQMSVNDLKYEGYFQSGCAMGGLFIAVEIQPYTNGPYVGSVCSRETERKMLDAFKHRGASLGLKAFIVLKQYNLLSKVSATLTFYITDCFGKFNFIPHFVKDAYYYEHSVIWRTSRTYFHHGVNKYYRWANSERTFHMDLPEGNCFQLNYFKLSQAMPKSEFALEFEQEFYFHLYSSDLRTPSVVSVAYRGPDQNLEHFEDCFADGIRLLMDEGNDEPYVYLTSFPDIISKTGYNFKIRMNLHCLWLGSSIHIQLERPKGADGVCFREIGGYMYDKMHPVIPQGLCGDVTIQLDSWVVRRISLQRPTQHPRCCFYELLIYIPDSVCANSVRIYQTAKHIYGELGHVVQTWILTKTDEQYLTWRGICRKMWGYDSLLESAIYSCMDMIVDTYSLCDMRLQFRASLMFEISDSAIYKVDTKHDTKTLCLKGSCYRVPVASDSLSWTDAHDICRKSNSSLTSINQYDRRVGTNY